MIAVSVGSFADPSFPPPTESGYDSRRHPWLAVPSTIERHDGTVTSTWMSIRITTRRLLGRLTSASPPSAKMLRAPTWSRPR
jgi:hypothetical protein